MSDLSKKAQQFLALHQGPGAFLIANAWDRGSARMLAALGFLAIATTSAGFARSMGDTDYTAGREAVLAHCRDLCSAVAVPVSADLENGFGHAPEACAETIRLAAATGLSGGSIEDATGDPADPIYPKEVAVERVRAAAEAARSLPHRFLLTARAENFLHGRPDLGDTIARLQAFQEAGADVLFAPGLRTAEDIRTVCAAVDLPVNVLRGPGVGVETVSELAALGVRRISVGNLFHSAAMSGMLEAARQVFDQGRFDFAVKIATGADLDRLLRNGAG